ncbi:MAG TPA: hypothetical protein VEY05_13545 [Beijerinckiaceae bacterium]|nr:hypothetical protein [Beijerinckiaceae bacterium]
MFVVIRRYAAGARADDVARRVGEGLVPILKQQPGFRAYYAFVGDDGRPVSVSVVDGRAAAMAANERAREWVAANMAELMSDPPEIVMGDMLVDAATFDEEEQQGRASGTASWVDGGV